MKWADGLIVTFYTMTLLVLGLFLIGFSLQVIPMEWVLGWAEEIRADESVRWQSVIIGFLFVLVSLGTMQMTRQRSRKQRHIVYKTDSGQVQVAIQALEELVREIGKEFLDVRSIRPWIRVRKNQITVRAALSLYSGAQVSHVAERMQIRIKTQMDTLLGKDVKVNCIVAVRHVDRRPPQRMKKPAADRSMQFGSSVQ